MLRCLEKISIQYSFNIHSFLYSFEVNKKAFSQADLDHEELHTNSIISVGGSDFPSYNILVRTLTSRKKMQKVASKEEGKLDVDHLLISFVFNCLRYNGKQGTS